SGTAHGCTAFRRANAACCRAKDDGATCRSADGHAAHALPQRVVAAHGNPAPTTVGIGEPHRPASAVPSGTRTAPSACIATGSRSGERAGPAKRQGAVKHPGAVKRQDAVQRPDAIQPAIATAQHASTDSCRARLTDTRDKGTG